MSTRRQGYRLSPQQRRIVERQGDRATFQAELDVEIRGPLDVARLSEAISAVVARHEILRTRFVTPRGLRWPLQVVEDGAPSVLSITERQAAPGSHLLEIRAPSLCADARSLQILFAEIVARYRGAPLPEPPTQYAQYADWWLGILEEARGTGSPIASSGRDPALVLPWEQRRDHASFDDTAQLSFPLDAQLIERIASRAGCPVEVVLLSGWLALLARLAGQPSATCRACVDGRIHEELEATLGPIDQLLPIRASIEASTRFVDLAAEVGRALRDARDRLEEACASVSENEEEGGADGAISIGFDYLDAVPEIRVDDTRFAARERRARLDRFKLRLSCTREGQQILATLRFDPAALQGEGVTRVARSLQALLRHADEQPERPVVVLDLLDPSDRARILALGAASPSLPAAVAAHHLFERQAARVPSAIAAEEGLSKVTYAELEELSNRMAARLRRGGVGPEVLVAVALEPSIALLVAMLGVLKAGGAFVPLNPRDPQQRFTRALRTARPHVIITRPDGRALVAESDAPVLVVDERGIAAGDDEASKEEGERTRAPSDALRSDNLAYVIFTSGSSGEPKGVCVSHRALINYLEWCARAYSPSGGAWVHSPASFDLGLTAILAPLVAGGRAVIVPNSHRRDALAEALSQGSDVGLLKLTPSHLRALRHQLAPERLTRLPEVLVVGGEALHHEDLALFLGEGSPVRVFNEYGPTEATVGCSVEPVGGGQDSAGPVSIGRPIPGARMLVLDEDMQPVPAGVKGALYIGGAGLARGYLRAPGATAQRFVPDPWSAEPGARLYRTGDIARILPDGRFEFFGRDDDQVKIRGHRLELGEVESALRRHPAVDECAALLRRRDEPGTEQLLLFATPRPGVSAPSSEELRSHLCLWLPEALSPASITVLDRLPRASGGKIDRAALLLAAPSAVTTPGAPRDETEEILAALFGQVLGVQSVGIDDNFFALGGDSIRSIRVVAGARERRIALSVEQIFASPTVRRLAESARSSRAEPFTPLAEPFALVSPEDRARMPEGVVDAYPLAVLQAGMIFHRDLASGSAVYHDIISFHLDIPLDEARFRAAVRALVERHPAQRTTFALAGFSEPLQLVHRSAPDPLSTEDISGHSAEAQDQAVKDHFARESARGLDPSALPLIRFHVHKRSEKTMQFTVSFHHAIIDGWSDATMLTELCHHYLSLLSGEDPRLTPPSASFRDFIALERRAIASRETADFWERTLAGSAPLRLPRLARPACPTRPTSESSERRMVRRALELPLELCRALRAVAALAAVPLKTVLLAAHARVMSSIGGSQDVLTCMVSSGRPEWTDGDRVLGLFINSVPVRARLEGGGTWLDLIQQAFSIEQELLPHRRLPMAEIQRRHGGEALSEVLFYFTDYHVYRSRETLGSVNVLEYTPHEETSFPLTVAFAVDPVGQGILFELTADEAILGREGVDVIEASFLRTLAALSQAPDARYDAHSVLSDDLRRRLLVEWNDTARDFLEPEACIHEMFDAAVERAPQAIAVIAEGVAWTYETLKRRADELAAHLCALGVGPESIVGVYMERRPELVIALLGVLKAGAAYLPLDPGHPSERLRSQLEEAVAPAVISMHPWLDSAPRREGAALIDLGAIPGGPIAPPSALGRPVDLDHPAYVIYTSGSTGRPKGVVNTHRGLRNRLLWGQSANPLEPADRVLQKTPFSFDVSVWELFWPLTTGAVLVVAPAEVHRDPRALSRVITAHGVTVMHFVPSLLDAFLDELTPGSLASLRLVVCSGEELTRSSCDRFFAKEPRAALCNFYGPTEAAIEVTAATCRRGDSGPVPIGRPIANIRAYVLDAWMEPAPPGVVGDLYVAGAGLARGYLRRPGLTAERFVPDPFAPAPGERMYSTGDLARFLPDGSIEFCGRADHQIKLRGVRIELGEIESVLREQPGVRAAAVRVLGERASAGMIAAYVVREDLSLTAEDLRRHLRRRLSEPMIPAAFTFLDALPVTSSGKVDRRALPDPRSASSEEEGAYDPPITPLEQAIASVWARVLEVPRVGRDDDFFALGGHSLLLMRVAGELRDLFKLHLPIRMLYERSTLSELAEGIEALQMAEVAEGAAPRRGA